MAKINRINPEGISKPFSNYSHVVTAEGAQKLVFCAGQVAADVDGNVLPPDNFDAQAKMVMKNLISALAIASSQRLASWPDIPTMGELGFPGFDHRGFVGLAAPGKTPAPVIAFLNKHLNDTINSASFRGRMEPLGMTIPADNTPEKFAAYMRTEMARQAELAKLSGHAPMEPKR